MNLQVKSLIPDRVIAQASRRNFVQLGLALAALLLLTMPWPAQGSTLIWRAPNASVTFGLPFASLEFENPLSGTEMVFSHTVLEWRDADFEYIPAPWFDDWTVSDPNNASGRPEEIYLLAANVSAQTTTTVPSTMISILLSGDDNDGKADVLVDGTTVAQLDMYTPPAGGCPTTLIIVRGLANTTHTITVNDLGPGQGGSDVHIGGAAALAENALKWNQPPLPAQPTNIFNGWNQPSIEPAPPWAADDWVCTNADPVTKIRWWGSFLNWTETNLPVQLNGFRIKFWTDVPKGADPLNPNLSHPGVLVTNIICTNFTASFAGWDYDPRSNRYEACFLFEQTLRPEEYFHQGPGTKTNWISIAAMQPPTSLYQWGWKTRPRSPTSPAPDAAVRFNPLANPPTYSLLWTIGSWDLAFELITSKSGVTAKWEQLPDLSTNGVDMAATDNPQMPPPNLLASDFKCNASGPITNITIWGSWFQDMFPGNPGNVRFALSFHSDIPDPDGSGPAYSMPGDLLWLRYFYPNDPNPFTWNIYAAELQEGWVDTPGGYLWPGDTMCVQYTFPIPAANAFVQTNGVIYWLDVQAMPTVQGPFRFGWKSSVTNWNDDSVFGMPDGGLEPREPWPGPWGELRRYWQPPEPGEQPASIDLAFRLITWGEQESTKWSQPPVLLTSSDVYYGWNQLSVDGGQQIVADDWACTNLMPVTDIHWWGSFIGWGDPVLPEQGGPTLPIAFNIMFWHDVPKGLDAEFSHPDGPIQQIICTNFAWNFAGWDFDPRNPFAPPEACFEYHQDLLPEEWFRQNPELGTNIYWISIAAIYPSGQTIQYPWGWKTRLRDPNSLAPDDAVYSDPSSPVWWLPIEYPAGVSWDAAFALTTLQESNCIQVVCSTNIAVTCAPATGAVVNYSSYATNICTGQLLPVTCSPPSGSLFPVGTNLVCCTNITGGITYSCCFTVTVLTDTTPPNINCPLPIILNTDPGLCSKSNVTWIATATDDCDPAPWIVCNPSSGSTFQKGVNTVICTAWDASGNTNTCSFTVTILDNELPRVYCPVNIVADTDPGLCSKSNVTWSANATDNCAVTNFACNPPSGSTFVKGTNTVTCTATDSSGNTSSCNFTVTILDNEAPVAQCPANIVAAADPGQSSKSNVTWTATATDNCPNPTVVCVPPSGSTFPFGTNTVCCTATDSSGNTNQCCFTVTILWPKPTTNIVITNIVFTTKFNGWNEPSVLGGTPTIAADDWVCTTTNPVTEIHWWGSFLGWKSNVPPALPNFQFGFWTDVPAIPGQLGSFSHPGELRKEVLCNSGSYTWKFAGWDLDPRTLEYEACFLFNQVLATNDWFYQTNQPNGTNIYWLSIAAFYPQGPVPESPWGWKTRPRATNSPAPDDAVRIFNYPHGPYEPIYWPYWTNSWDLAFELVSSYTNVIEKWYQPPDTYSTGWDVNDTDYGVPNPAPTLLADDFACRVTGPVTDISIWGSWRENLVPPVPVATFTLSIHKDVTNVFSMPGPVLWTNTFGPGQYQETPAQVYDLEGWFSPGVGFWPMDHANCFRYDFHVASNAFVQTNGNVYWLDVQAQLPPLAPAQFGWKTTRDPFRWHDAAVWANGTDLSHGAWTPLYRPLEGTFMDLAFAVSTSQSFYQLKWSQPPVASRYLTVQWTWEDFIHYQLQATTYLSNAPAHCVWSNVGPEVIGPVHEQSDTNTAAPQRFYRVVAPNVVP